MGSPDPIADMFTSIRNGLKAELEKVIMPCSSVKIQIAKILKDEGYIKYYEILSEDLKKKQIKIGLKYNVDGNPTITEIKRVSKSGKRIYVKKASVPKVRSGFGTSIVSTSKGVMTGKAARLSNVGGELIGIVY